MAKKNTKEWSPDSWLNYPVQQLPEYTDKKLLKSVFKELKGYPPLVNSWEVEDLRDQLALAARGKAFLLQGGDCAEVFDNCNAPQTVNLLKVLLQMSFILIHEMNIPVIRVGRIAGQYAKPRSSPVEKVGSEEIPTYRGDLFNKYQQDLEARVTNPKRLLEGYKLSALTLNFIRSLTEGKGFANLNHPEYWELDFMRRNKYYKEYESMVKSITNAVRFVETITNDRIDAMRQVRIHTSHEALNLYYDSAQTIQVPHNKGWYNLSTHMPWLGNRTRDLDGAHVEYFRGIRNPVGVKVGPPFENEEVVKLLDKLNPDNVEGKVTLITRMGKDNVKKYLPGLIQTVKNSGHSVIWSCDPMHGNTYATEENLKTRSFNDILTEIKETFQVHREEGSFLGGVHLELTGDNVTECVGGANGLKAEGLKRNYKTFCDPRLNYQQSLEMAYLITKEWKATWNER
ncbi:3-deoxy-7-phosphoheptulonate synthase class II [Balneolaceae bacterium ANBcel3]|nr:3-deoxy-7-phosphoheptulonate synthase class II [Balneolaceae bacterium ANBcel3]